MCDIVVYLYQDILVIIICAHGDLSVDHDSYYLLGNFTEHQVLQIIQLYEHYLTAFWLLASTMYQGKYFKCKSAHRQFSMKPEQSEKLRLVVSKQYRTELFCYIEIVTYGSLIFDIMQLGSYFT